MVAASTSYVLDTGVALVLARGGALASRIAESFGLRRVGVRPLLSIVSHGELRALAKRRAWGTDKQRALDKIISCCVTVELSGPVIDSYVDLLIAGLDAGAGIGQNDLWIAATARAAKATLLTLDKDFDHLAGLWIDRHYIDQRIGARQ